MSDEAAQIIDAYGGTTAVARLLKLPPSTVHSWRRSGISASRLDHLRLAANAAGVRVEHVDADIPADGEPSPGIDADFTAERAA